MKILRNEPARRKRLFVNLAYVRIKLRSAGWEISETPGPIVRLPLMSEATAGALKQRLLAAGIYPPFLKYGSSSAQGIFRFVISSEHTRPHLDNLIATLVAFRKSATNRSLWPTG